MLGKKIATLRKEMKLSQYEMAERLGISRGKLANYEQGSRQPDYETLQQIADFFDVTTDYLLGREIVSKNESAKIESNLNDEQTNLMFDGWLEMSEEQRQEALEFMEFLKSKNKGK